MGTKRQTIHRGSKKERITPRAIELFKQILLANTKATTDERMRPQDLLSSEVKLETWQYFFGRDKWPCKYIDDSKLRGQLEEVLATVAARDA